MKKILRNMYSFLAFSGLWLVPLIFLFLPRVFSFLTTRQLITVSILLAGWTFFNNLWSLMCEGKQVEELKIGDGLIPETGLRKESAQKRTAAYPKAPADLLSKEPEGIILGTYKKRYVRLPLSYGYHSCVIGGSGSGKTSTVLLDTLLANFATKRESFNCFAIDVKGELHQKSAFAFSEKVLVVDPTDRSACGWDVYYRLHEHPDDDLIIEVMEEISQALVISTNPKDMFFVENARAMLVGLLTYYFQQGESFIDAVNKILEANVEALITEIIKDSEPSELHFKYLAKFQERDGVESVQNCAVELTTGLSVFSKSSVKFCFRDNLQKASPASFGEGKSVFLAIPESQLENLTAVMRLCTVQTLKALERRSEEEETPMLVLLDEFARIGRVSGIFNALATLRSKKVMVMLAFQSLAQIEVNYSKEESRVLVENCRAKIICECSDPETSKTIQAWAGTYRDKKETLSSGKGKHKTYTYEDKNLLEGSDFITLTKKKEVLLIISGVGYLRVKKCHYFLDEKLKKLAEKVRNYHKSFER